MPIFGITLTSADGVVETVEISEEAEVREVADEYSAHGFSKIINSVQTFKASGRGNSLPLQVGGAPSIDNLANTAFVTETKQISSNVEFFTWQYSGQAFPTIT
jgi:hypothetical protein